MGASPAVAIRRAAPEDAPTVARMLRGFNAEFDEPAPPQEVLERRLRVAISIGQNVVLLAGRDPGGLAQMRFLRTVWSDAPSVYLEELYVVPELRGQGIGRALLEATLATARAGGADRIDLNTATDDTVARALYESAGFSNREGGPDGASMLYYERDL